jgi:histidinol-phosphate/aromatic aminotransferase/cobyric acid decarboxylase-like protein
LAAYLLAEGIVVRAMHQYPALQDCVRISIGTLEENARLLTVLEHYSGDNDA